jgi:hypothetical protein
MEDIRSLSELEYGALKEINGNMLTLLDPGSLNCLLRRINTIVDQNSEIDRNSVFDQNF